METKIYNSYLALLKKYGEPKEFWREWCKEGKSDKEREKIVLGAILTQRTNWRNVELALGNLKRENCLSVEKIYQLGKQDISVLELLIRPTGFYKQKAKRIFGLCQFVIEKHGSLKKFFQLPVASCRKELLILTGIGPETADSILLYAGDKLTFVIDEYTCRFVKKHNLSSKFSYDYLQQLFQDNLPKDIKIYRDFHAMIVLEGRGTGWDLVSDIRQKKIL